jgi:hypothetical protein
MYINLTLFTDSAIEFADQIGKNSIWHALILLQVKNKIQGCLCCINVGRELAVFWTAGALACKKSHPFTF